MISSPADTALMPVLPKRDASATNWLTGANKFLLKRADRYEGFYPATGMALKAGHRLLIRDLQSHRLGSHPFSTFTCLYAEQHHTYFQKGTNHISFPPNSRILDNDHNDPRPSLWSRLTSPRDPNHGPLTPQQHRSATQDGSSASEGPGSMQGWSMFLSGFLLFPVVYSYLKAGQWAFGTKPSASELASLEQQGLGASRGSRDSNDQFMESHNLYSILQRANAETKALHDLIHLLINPDEHIRAFRDRATVDDHPIRMSSGKILATSKVTLVNVLNKEGKTLALILGVDMEGHDGSETDPNLDWCHDYALRNWMDERAAEMKTHGEAAEAGIGLFCYTATSSATSLPGKAENWQEARLFPQDLPEGFPLKVFEKLPSGPTLEDFRQMEEEGG